MATTNPTTEAAVLQAVVLAGQSTSGRTSSWSLLTALSGGDPRSLFGDFKMRTIAHAVHTLHQRGSNISPYTVRDYMLATSTAQSDEGEGDTPRADVADMAMRALGDAPLIASEQEFTHAVESLVSARAERAAVDFVNDLHQEVQSGDLTPGQIVDRCRSFSVEGAYGDTKMLTANDVFRSIMDDMQSESLWTLNTGVTDLDAVVQWEPEQLTIVSGVSYTASKGFLINSAINALDQGATVVFASHDFTPRQLYAHLLSCASSVPRKSLYAYFSGAEDSIEPDDVEKVQAAQKWLAERGDKLHLLFREHLPQGIQSLPSKIASLVQQGESADDPVLVLYDSLQTSYLDMLANGLVKGNTFSLSATASRTARTLTRSFGVSMVLLAQAKLKEVRGVTEYAGLEGVAASVTQDADLLVTTKPHDNADSTDVTFSVKSPDGEPQQVRLWFDSTNSTFTESRIDDGESEEDQRTFVYSGERSNNPGADKEAIDVPWDDSDDIPISSESTRGGGGNGRRAQRPTLD